MEVNRSEIGSVVILSLSGPLVADEQSKLIAKVDACLTDGITRVVVDMKQVPFTDSVGLETLQSLVPEFARKGADFRITGLNDVCRDIFIATRMMSFFHVTEDTDTAVRSFR